MTLSSSTHRPRLPARAVQVFPLLRRHSANFNRDLVVYNFG